MQATPHPTPDTPIHPTIPYATPGPRRGGWRILLLVVAILLMMVIAGGVTYLALAGRRVQIATVAGARATAARLAMPEKEVEVTVIQRESQAIPGSNGRVVLKLGDVTGGQALVSVEQSDGQTLLATQSMAKGDTARFSVGSAQYEVKAKELRNFLTGDDFGVFIIAPARGALSEAQKIERLIQYVTKLEGAIFIRNSTEHTPAEAAEHMRNKLALAGEQVKTAKQFIEAAATKSSISGKPYKVRLKDGTEVNAGELLLDELRQLEKPATSQPAPK